MKLDLFDEINALRAALVERDRIIAKQHRIIEEQGRLIAEQARQISMLTVRVADLEEKLGKNSSNSSKPPSSDGPGSKVQRRNRKKKSGRRPGAQQGHTRHDRPIVPPEAVSDTIVLKPETCESCGTALSGEDPNPIRQLVFEIPKIVPLVIEYLRHGLICRCCGRLNRLPLPNGLSAGSFGPRVVSLVALLAGAFRLSHRSIVRLMADLFSLPMAVGSVTGCLSEMSAALAKPVAEAFEYAAKQPVKHADETSWRERRKRAYLWTLVTNSVTVFMIHVHRSSEAARRLLPMIQGVLVTDRYAGYAFWPSLLRQFCWAHLTRDFIGISQRRGDGLLGRRLRREARKLFKLWGRLRDGTLKRSTFRLYMKPIQIRVEALLESGRHSQNAKTRGTCGEILKFRESLWTFVRREGVEPTNNTSERKIRHGVMWRKTSHGTHSPAGSRFVERILTVHATLRQQGRNVLEFLHAARMAFLTKTTPPSLLREETRPETLQLAA